MIIVILFTDKRNWNNSIHEIRSWFSFSFSESSLGHEILREQRNVLSSFDDLVSTIVISDFQIAAHLKNCGWFSYTKYKVVYNCWNLSYCSFNAFPSFPTPPAKQRLQITYWINDTFIQFNE